MGKHLVLVGGGHAHMVTLANISKFREKGHRVTVIGPSDFHYYSGMGPGMLGGTYTPGEIRFATRHVVEKQGGTFILAKAERVDPRSRQVLLDSGQTVDYDVVSFNAGSHVPRTIVSGDATDIYSVKPIEKLMEARDRLKELMSQKSIRVGIVGGGPSSAEIGGNLWRLASSNGLHMPKIHIFAGKRYMPRFPERVRKLVIRSITRRGIAVHEGDYVKGVKTGGITLDSGKTVALDFIFMALGVRPSGIFEASGLPTGPDHGLLVNRYLQCVEHPEIFGGGDCIYFKDSPLDKVGVYAVRQNPILYHNLMAGLEGKPLKPFDPGPEYLLIFNLGDSTGVLKKRWLVMDGRVAFKLKDFIDRKFMKKFQAIEA
ncbi:MAG: FAD-dependent oxidoreductase [Pseudomonadota bacterium]